MKLRQPATVRHGPPGRGFVTEPEQSADTVVTNAAHTEADDGAWSPEATLR